MPANIVLDKLRTRRGLKWGVLAMFLSVVYFYLVALMSVLVNDGASKWLYVVMLVCIWNAFKFLIYRPVSLVTLMRVRLAERRARVAEERAQQHLASA